MNYFDKINRNNGGKSRSNLLNVIALNRHQFHVTKSRASRLIACPTQRSQASSICRAVAGFRDAVVVRDAGIGLQEILPTVAIFTANSTIMTDRFETL